MWCDNLNGKTIQKRTDKCICINESLFCMPETNTTLLISYTPIQKGFGVKKIKIQFSSVAQLCPTLCNPMDCSTPSFPVHHQLPELAQTHVHRVGDTIQASHPLSSPSPPAFSLSQHQVLCHWFTSSYHVTEALEFQLQDQSFQWIFRMDFL